MSENQKLISQLSQQLHKYKQAVIPGTGVAIKDGDLVFIPPGEIHLDRLESQDIFTFNIDFDNDGNPELNKDAVSPCHNISAYTNLYLRIFQEFDCGCVIYAQPVNANVVSSIFKKDFRIKNNQLISQISNGETKEQYPWNHELKIPIIDNPDDQTKLFSDLEKAFSINPETNAVLIRGNGIVVCGDTWQETKLMFESMLQLFDTAIELRKVNQVQKDVNNTAPPAKKAAVKSFSQKPKENGKDEEISVVHESKPVKKGKVSTKATPAITKKYSKVPSGLQDDSHKAEALKRKKLALARLRDRAASNNQASRFMNNLSRSMNNESRTSMSGMNNSMGGGLVIGGNSSMGGMNNSMGGMNNSMGGMNNSMGVMNNSMGGGMNNSMNGMNNMNNMMMNNMNNMNNMMMGNNMMGNMNMMDMNNGMFQGGDDMGGMQINNSDRGFNSMKRVSKMRGVVARKGVPARKVANKGNVKQRLGFKSNISVDPALLREGNVNTEDY